MGMSSNHSRYSRQVLFWPRQNEDQTLLKDKIVTLIGVGALGTIIANHLVRAGVGTIRIIDRDFIELSNLQRQMLFNESDVNNNLPKVVAAKEKLQLINSEVSIIPFIQDVNSQTIENLVENSDIIIDATDNMETRFLINDVSIKYGIPWVYGGAVHSRGMFFSIIPGETPCLRCLFPGSHQNHGETCDTVGVLGPLVHIIASYQVTEAMKILLGYKEKRNTHLNQLDIWDYDYDELPIEFTRNPNCDCCVKNDYYYLNRQSNDMFISQLCGRDSIQITPNTSMNMNLRSWERKWQPLGQVLCTPFLVRLQYEKYQLTLFQDGRLLIKGTQSEIEAKKLYARFVGS